MTRWLIALAGTVLLSGCVSTTYYHRGIDGGGYYSSEPIGYYDRDLAWRDPAGRYAWGYTWYGPWNTGWGYRPYAWTIGWGWGCSDWSVWGHPCHGFGAWGFYGDPWLASAWSGFGPYGGWGYPGFRDPWLSSWWPWVLDWHRHNRGLDRDLRIARRDASDRAARRHRTPPRSAPVSAAVPGRPLSHDLRRAVLPPPVSGPRWDDQPRGTPRRSALAELPGPRLPSDRVWREPPATVPARTRPVRSARQVPVITRSGTASSTPSRRRRSNAVPSPTLRRSMPTRAPRRSAGASGG